MEIHKPTRRHRHHPEEFKRAVIAACCEPGASVAGIAMARGGSANPDIELSEISASMGDGNRLPRSRSNEKTPP